MLNSKLSAKTVAVWSLPVGSGFHKFWTGEDLQQLFSKKELTRYHKFKAATRRDEFLASRLLLRFLLPRYIDIPQAQLKEIEVIPNNMGRPYWQLQSKKIPLYFSLSHTKGMVCCTISSWQETGCDVERIHRRKYEKKLTETVFSDPEKRYYQTLPPEKRTIFFCKAWTIKEAVVKGLGLGLRLPLPFFSLAHLVEYDKNCSLLLTSPKSKHRENWTIFTTRLHNSYCLSIASAQPNAKITLHHCRMEDNKIKEI